MERICFGNLQLSWKLFVRLDELLPKCPATLNDEAPYFR